MHDDVTAVFDGAAQVRRRNSVVDDDRDPVCMGNVSDLFKVHHVSCRVADRFAVDCLGLAINQSSHCIEIFRIDKPGFDPKLGKGMGKEVVGPTIQSGHADEVVTGLGNGH